MKNLTKDATLKDSTRFRFVIAGKAIFTFKSLETGKKLVFYALKSKIVRQAPVRFIYVKVDKEWVHIGAIYLNLPGRPFHYSSKSTLRKKDFRVIAFEWLWYRLNRNMDFNGQAEMKHAGKCGKCGRTLTDEKSVTRGFGPVCWKRVSKGGISWLTK
jgi:hypothetical protein